MAPEANCRLFATFTQNGIPEGNVGSGLAPPGQRQRSIAHVVQHILQLDSL